MIGEPQDEGSTLRDVAVVAIGVPPGGLKAVKLLLSTLPAQTDFAIVILQQSDPDGKDFFDEAALLGRATRMPVRVAAEGVCLEANHVYVIPPHTVANIHHRVMRLSARTKSLGPYQSIQPFFRSLAQDCGAKAVGVILTGTGSDGPLGLQAIKAAGGVTFMQGPPTDAVPGVDFVLPLEDIAAELARLATHPHFIPAEDQPRETAEPGGAPGYLEILALMRESAGIDFSLYRETMVHRRIARRIALRNLESMEQYSAVLKQDAGERALLHQDLLITVTGFFRDPSSFEALTQVVFPALVRNRPASSRIRIWVPGCSTGEEAYSIAIALQEYLKNEGASFPVQIFASDVNPAALDRARSGRYAESIAADVSPERLSRYFTRVEGGYQISRALRELCVFSRHNLIDDPAFARLDLISCRNVLIYLRAVQRNILPMFHYALNPGGFLMLGRPETAGCDDLFALLDTNNKIYQRIETSKGFHRIHTRTLQGRKSGQGGKMAPVPELWDGLEVGKAVDHVLLSKYSPAAVLVDEEMEVLEVRGDPTPFFRVPEGAASYPLLKLIRDAGLFLEIEKLIRLVEQNGTTARRLNVTYETGGQVREVNLEVSPLHGEQRRALLVLVEPVRSVDEDLQEMLARAALARGDEEILKLKAEISEARQRLRLAMENYQATDRESQHAVREARSSNEDLQSLNEELETAKEELQSTNEELITLNQELGFKNAALSESSAFALSIVETIHVPLLVLDSSMRIRTINEWFCKTFLIGRADAEGHLLDSLDQGSWNIPGLRERVARVLSSEEPFEHFEVTRAFPSAGTRNLIFNGRRLAHFPLALLSIEDVTARKNAEQALHESLEALRQAQKMEAIGRLAGGIAHDFNNLLTAIIGYSTLVAGGLDSGHSALEDVYEIERAGQRAAALTHQLLAFSRRKVLKPKIFDINLVVVDFEKMLRRIVGEHIQVEVRLSSDLLRVKADPGEIGRALMNLCLNARDAMPAGGTLTIQTENVTLAATGTLPAKLAPGPYVRLAVHDSGIGMDADTQAHIFEPFFTTKEAGKGTGLGLAAVHGIVNQSGGAIWCKSELGVGTTFNVLVPGIAAMSDLEEHSLGTLVDAPKGSAEVILVVEDEDQVRKLACRILEDRGYVVMEAKDGREALAIAEAYPERLDLLLTDVVLPQFGGRALAEQIQAARPGVKVLFMSGYTEDMISKEGIPAGTPLLSKPFAPAELAHRVRKVLDTPASK